MKKIIYLFAAVLMAMSITACKPKIHYLANCNGIYIETSEGRRYGVESEGQIRLEPIWDDIGYGDLSGRVYQAWKNDEVRLFDYLGNVLCDSIPLVGKDREKLEFAYIAGGSGVPGRFNLAHTQEGVFGMYYDQERASWYQYGPFGDYVAGTAGYMFKHNKTGKWGAARYGKWIDAARDYGAAQWRFFYERYAVIILPEYEKIINVSYVSKGMADGGRRGYEKESDVRWYVYDGTKWHALDIHGKPTAIRNSELKLAQSLTPHTGRVRYNSLHNIITQRIGTNEASMVLINNRADRLM